MARLAIVLSYLESCGLVLPEYGPGGVFLNEMYSRFDYKLFEELCFEGENVISTRHPKINRLVSDPVPLEQVRYRLNELVWQSNLLEPDQLKSLLKWAVPECQPQLAAQAISEQLPPKESWLSLNPTPFQSNSKFWPAIWWCQPRETIALENFRGCR